MSSLLRLRGRNWRLVTSQLTKTLLDAVLPPICAGCGVVGVSFCDDCRLGVHWIEKPICLSCGRPADNQTAQCTACLASPLNLKPIRAATLHHDPVRKILHQMKYEGFFALAQPLGQLMVAAWPKWKHIVDLVVPIPLHPRRRWDRGYNQSELLADVFAHEVNLKMVTGALTRKRHTRPQIGLTAEERRANVLGAFEAIPDLVVGKQVLLVDDVFTTGSTLSAAADALYKAGARAVSAYCLSAAYQDPAARLPIN